MLIPPQKRSGLRIVRAVVDLGRRHGYRHGRRGSGDQSQVVGLKMLGCQVAQGFYFSHPLHADEFDQLLTRHFAPVAELPGQRLPGQRVHP